MPKAKQQKQEIVAGIESKLKTAKSAVIASIDGLTVAASQELRGKLADEQVNFFAVKKTLLQRALELVGWSGLDAKSLSGSLGVAISQTDEVAPAKIIKGFSKTHEQVKFRAGVVEGKVLSTEELLSLASLPSKQELLGKVVGTLQAPISGFVRTLSGNLSGLVNVLNAIKNNKA